MAWASASTLVAAAIFRGSFLIMTASRMTKSAIISEFTIPTFSCFSGTATMALGVASDPVPAVVGIMRDLMHFLACVGVSSSSLMPYSSVIRMLASLAVSMTLPPPTAMMKSAPQALHWSTSFWASA